MLQMFCWHATFQNFMDPILTDAETLLALIGMGLMPLRTGCFAFTPCIPDSNMLESIRHTRCVPFRHVEHLLYWSKVLVQPQACSNHCMCTCTSVQTHRMAENSYLAGNKGEKGWLAVGEAC